LRVLIDIGHPAHVHFYRNAIKELEEKGHEIIVTARDKEVTINLLEAYDIDYTVLSSMKQGKANLIKEWIVRDYKLLNIARKFKPDVLTGILNPCVAHVSWLMGKKSIIFNDTEHATFAQKITYPFSDVICTPSCFNKPVGKKQLNYDGYHELAYLHPKYFKPDSSVLQEIGLNEDDIFSIVRFVSWGASHDVGCTGLSFETKRKVVHELSKYSRVLISSEKTLDKEFEQYRVTIPPEKMHDLLYYATLLYGESATMASECAVLGTHAIFCDFAGRGYTNEEEEKYDLVYNFKLDEESQKKSLKKAIELLNDSDLNEKGRQKRELLLKDKMDVTEFMVDFVENYSNENKMG
jgi:predicted glycosyltransferase